MKVKQIIITVLAIVSLSSCVTSKKLTYLQADGDRDTLIISVTPSAYKIQPYDNLFIKVITPDPKWSEMFNTMSATGSGISITEQSADMFSYTVGGDGFIELPYAGKFMVAGKTLGVIKTEFQDTLKSYIADASVTVKMVNNYVSLMGEIQKPGRYPIYKDRLNIFQALAMGSDLGEYSDRQKVQVIRQTTDGNIIKNFSLNDRSIMSSEFFYVMPNDIIYAKPMKGKFFQLNAFPYAIVLNAVTTFVLLWSVIKQ
jgi:polysaccharide biosynthesis/export protein